MMSDGLDVVIIGGAGDMGRWAVRAIAQLGSARRLRIADRNISRAVRLATEVGQPCEALELDATDSYALQAVFSDCDVVLNTMGPFATFGERILRAAIVARCDYLDIDDDWQSTLAALELDGAARKCGVRAVIGLGSSPGVSNLCAVEAAQRLDHVDEVITGWKLSGAVVAHDPNYPPTGAVGAATQHWLLQTSTDITLWSDGRASVTRPLQRRQIEYPGIGPATVYTVGHPEAVTLPQYLHGIQRASNVMSGPDWMFEHLTAVAQQYRANSISLEAAAESLANPPRPAGPSYRDPLPICWAMAIGRRAGRETRVAVHLRAWPPGRMGGNTGVPLAIGLELLRRGRIAELGVHAPEGTIEPGEFFDLMTQFVPNLDGEPLLILAESSR